MHKELIYETTCNPYHFLYSISETYCINFKALFKIMAKSTYFHWFPFFCLIDPRTLNKFWTQNPFYFTHMYFVSILISTNHPPHKYMCPTKIGNRFRHVCLIPYWVLFIFEGPKVNRYRPQAPISTLRKLF